jgi:hypothetical protein
MSMNRRPTPVQPLPRPDRVARLSAIVHTPEEVDRKARRIYSDVLAASEHIQTGNFTALGLADLMRMFGLYDKEFFDGLLEQFLREDHAYPVGYRLSGRLTRSAGTTVRRRFRIPVPGGTEARVDYTITISTTLLFNTFRHAGRPVSVSGRLVADRLEALQRIFEHELLHLAENLVWDQSSCSADNFQQLSRRIFAHEAPHHELVTPREQAAVEHGIHVGDLVSFEHEGVGRVGRVNRITRRATVLVEDPTGRLYSDGKIYATFYVPLSFLQKTT